MCKSYIFSSVKIPPDLLKELTQATKENFMNEDYNDYNEETKNICASLQYTYPGVKSANDKDKGEKAKLAQQLSMDQKLLNILFTDLLKELWNSCQNNVEKKLENYLSTSSKYYFSFYLVLLTYSLSLSPLSISLLSIYSIFFLLLLIILYFL